MINFIKHAAVIFVLQATCLWWGFAIWSSRHVGLSDVPSVATTMTLFYVALGFIGFLLTAVIGASYIISKQPKPVKLEVISGGRKNS